MRWHAGHLLCLARTAAAVMAFSQHSPEEGCRLALVADVESSDDYLRDGAVFADPCHRAVFALDSTHLGVPGETVEPAELHSEVSKRIGTRV